MTRDRCIVNVATGRYLHGQMRLLAALNGDRKHFVSGRMPEGCPPHAEVPYAFKAYALKEAAQRYPVLLWCDASILPGPRGLKDLWERIESEGYWFSKNGFKNSQWTAKERLNDLGVTEEENDKIEHVVATAFGIDLRKSLGEMFLHHYFALAQTQAFCGPWTGGIGVQHRHDQTAASVIAYRLGFELTDPPQWFAYRGGETKQTALVADGGF